MDIKYKPKSFRLNEKTLERLENLKIKSGKSWNILFKNLLDLEKQYGMPEMLARRDDKKNT